MLDRSHVFVMRDSPRENATFQVHHTYFFSNSRRLASAAPQPYCLGEIFEMKATKRRRNPATTGHALALARWEDNREGWLKGDYFGLTSKRTDLQDLVGDGGTLWIIVSRRRPKGGRGYSLSFRLDGCKRHRFSKTGKFGKYGVYGDPERSRLFPSVDARLLLLALRFEPYKPIDDQSDRLKVIGNSIQTPRQLNSADVKLLENFSLDADYWSNFISYQRTEADISKATRLANQLTREGISVYRDQEALRPGQRMWPALSDAVERAKNLILLIGPTTHKSQWVKKEVRHAIEHSTNIIPILAGGSLENWREFRLHKIHAAEYKSVLEDGLLLRAIRMSSGI